MHAKLSYRVTLHHVKFLAHAHSFSRSPDSNLDTTPIAKAIRAAVCARLSSNSWSRRCFCASFAAAFSACHLERNSAFTGLTDSSHI